MMLIVALLLGLSLPVQALAIPLSYQFAGTLGDGGSVNGFLNYESSAPPIATNVRGLAPNAVYQPTSWGMTIVSPLAIGSVVPTSLEFCLGKCLFGAVETTTLRFSMAGTNVLQLAFDGTFGQNIWGATHLQTTNEQGLPRLILFESFQTTSSVPEPTPFWMLAIGLLAIWRTSAFLQHV